MFRRKRKNPPPLRWLPTTPGGLLDSPEVSSGPESDPFLSSIESLAESLHYSLPKLPPKSGGSSSPPLLYPQAIACHVKTSGGMPKNATYEKRAMAKFEAGAQTRARDTGACSEDKEASKKEDMCRLEKARQFLEEAERLEAHARVTEASIKIRDAAVQKKEAEVNLKNLEIKRCEADVHRWEDEVTRREGDARKKEEDVRHLEEKAQESGGCSA